MTESKRIGARMLPIGHLCPHPLNANVLPDDLKAKLRAHIKRTGRYPFIVVRPHPDEPDKYQILDGHHRIEVLRELGHREVRCDVWDVDEHEAKLLLAYSIAVAPDSSLRIFFRISILITTSFSDRLAPLSRCD